MAVRFAPNVFHAALGGLTLLPFAERSISTPTAINRGYRKHRGIAGIGVLLALEYCLPASLWKGKFKEVINAARCCIGVEYQSTRGARVHANGQHAEVQTAGTSGHGNHLRCTDRRVADHRVVTSGHRERYKFRGALTHSFLM